MVEWVVVPYDNRDITKKAHARKLVKSPDVLEGGKTENDHVFLKLSLFRHI